eukprot:6106284-Amphidinium_carterae.1
MERYNHFGQDRILRTTIADPAVQFQHKLLPITVPGENISYEILNTFVSGTVTVTVGNGYSNSYENNSARSYVGNCV